MWKTKIKITPISVISTVGIIIGLPYGLYGLILKGGSSLGGVLILVGVIAIAILFLVDRIVTHFFKYKVIIILELIFIAVVSVFYLHSKREYYLESSTGADYFVLIENNGTWENSKVEYVFPFSKLIRTSKNFAVIKSIDEYYQQFTLNAPKNWNSTQMQPDKIDNVRVQFYSNSKFTEIQKDSIIKKEIRTATNSG